MDFIHSSSDPYIVPVSGLLPQANETVSFLKKPLARYRTTPDEQTDNVCANCKTDAPTDYACGNIPMDASRYAAGILYERILPLRLDEKIRFVLT